MRNPTGHQLQILPLKNADIKYGWRVVDPVNKVNYDITEEPWASICAAAYSSQGREPIFSDVRIVYEGANPANKGYIEDYDILSAAGLVFTSVTDMMNYLYSVDFHGCNLTIEFCGELPDMWLYTDRLISCGRVYIHYAGEDPADNGTSDTAVNMTTANACVSKCCGLRVYGPVTTYVSGSIILQSDPKGMCDLFYLENAYIHFTNLQIRIDRATDTTNGWVADPNISYPALILAGMNSKMEFNNRLIIVFGGAGTVKTRTWPFYLILCVNYAYCLMAASASITIRHADSTKLWTMSSKPPFMATRFALMRLSSTKRGWDGAFTLGSGLTGCQASVNGYIDTSTEMSAMLNGCGLKTSKETTQGQVRFG